MANYQLTIDSLVQDNNQVATRWTATGIHRGSFFGETPTQKQVVVRGMTFFVFTGTRISEDFEVIDFDGLRRQVQAK